MPLIEVGAKIDKSHDKKPALAAAKKLNFSRKKALAMARRVINIESRSISSLKGRLGDDFINACALLRDCVGRIVFIAIGKSGFIASKIASTLASTGSPAFFIHAAEASHGDLGMVVSSDVVVFLSNSGETAEISNLLPALKRRGVATISLCGDLASTLAKNTDVNLDISVPEEACPLNLAPTASTTAALVMGDALALALLNARGFTSDDFAHNHPGGQLGRRLLLRVEDIMHRGDEIPRVPLTALMPQALCEMSAKRLGMTLVIDEDDSVAGIFTDGDLRRSLDRGVNMQTTMARETMTKNCHTVTIGSLAVAALKLMEEEAINAVPVIDEKNRIAGALNIHDLLRAGI